MPLRVTPPRTLAMEPWASSIVFKRLQNQLKLGIRQALTTQTFQILTTPKGDLNLNNLKKVL